VLPPALMVWATIKAATNTAAREIHFFMKHLLWKKRGIAN
jgi:hypothetical protein